jgi:hypothetical protein
VLAPDGKPQAPAPRQRVDSTLIKALARAHRWRRLLDEGLYASPADLARAERISPSYVFRLLRLTLLAPDIVEAILDGSQPPLLLAQDFAASAIPDCWEEQRRGLRLQPNAFA